MTQAGQPPPPQQPSSIPGILIRAGLFLLFIWICVGILGGFLNEAVGYFPAAALAVFAAATFATSTVMRVFERATLAQAGMGWTSLTSKQLRIGIVVGVFTGAVVSLTPLALGMAHFERITEADAGFSFARLIFVTVLLLFGAVGEELMFRGYAFQIVLAAFGPLATVFPFALIFAWAHAGNLNTGPIGLINTALWGVILGYAVVRAGSLWLAIGLHFGWNWVLPMLGTNLSGFSLSVSGYKLTSSGPDFVTGGAYGPEGGLLTTLAALSIGYWLYRGRIEHQPGMLVHPDNREDGTDVPASHLGVTSGAPGGPVSEGRPRAQADGRGED